MKARWNADPTRCAQRVLPKDGRESKPSRMLRVSVIVMPPDDAGGIDSSVCPRYVERMGVRHSAL
ncbi:hypothetical protein D3C83_122870 [compost metagenome]